MGPESAGLISLHRLATLNIREDEGGLLSPQKAIQVLRSEAFTGNWRSRLIILAAAPLVLARRFTFKEGAEDLASMFPPYPASKPRNRFLAFWSSLKIRVLVQPMILAVSVREYPSK